MTAEAKILGAVLAGGQSSRFGSDKAQALLAGKPLIEHVIAALAPQVDELVVCGRRHEGVASLVDRPGPGLGPLGGLNAALNYGLGQGFEAVLTVGCDMPDLPPDLLTMFKVSEPAVLAGQRLVGLWPTTLAAELDDFLAASQDRSIRAWLRVAQGREVSFPGIVANVNYPDDLNKLAARPR